MHEVLPWIPLPQQKDNLNPLEKSKTSTKYKRRDCVDAFSWFEIMEFSQFLIISTFSGTGKWLHSKSGQI